VTSVVAKLPGGLHRLEHTSLSRSRGMSWCAHVRDQRRGAAPKATTRLAVLTDCHAEHVGYLHPLQCYCLTSCAGKRFSHTTRFTAQTPSSEAAAKNWRSLAGISCHRNLSFQQRSPTKPLHPDSARHQNLTIAPPMNASRTEPCRRIFRLPEVEARSSRSAAACFVMR
jgi:hypothetical protein